jgi:hypothetical protein
VLGIQVKFKPQIAEPQSAPATTPIAVVAPEPVESAPVEPLPVSEPEPLAEPEPVEPEPEAPEPVEPDSKPQPAAVEPEISKPTKSRNSNMVDDSARYGESLLREVLGAEPIIDKNAGK